MKCCWESWNYQQYKRPQTSEVSLFCKPHKMLQIKPKYSKKYIYITMGIIKPFFLMKSIWFEEN